MVSIQSQIQTIRATVPADVRLIAVTKYVTPVEIREAYQAGLRDFGESRIQEAQAKKQNLKDLIGITWHFIGHLQSNKAKQALEQFDWIHSVDSLKLATRLNLLSKDLRLNPNICLQVKLRPDPNKQGWDVAQLLRDRVELKKLNYLNIKGLMTILPIGLPEPEILQAFQDTATLAQTLRSDPQAPLNIAELSMGMSQDYLLAIQAGATMVRLGRILFPNL